MEILNYRKAGTPFWNIFTIFPVYDRKGKVLAFFAIQKDVTYIKLSAVPPSEWKNIEVIIFPTGNVT